MGDHATVFGRVATGEALEGLRAWVCGCTTGDFPFIGPVAVVVTANAGAGGHGLAVFAPEAVVCLGVYEA